MDPDTEKAFDAAIPLRYRDARLLDDFDADLRVALAEWASLREKPNLILVGPVGTGKTHAAVATARECVETGIERSRGTSADGGEMLYTERPSVVFVRASALFDALRPDGIGRVTDYTDAGLLILDDYGVEKATEWTRERLDAIVSARYDAMLPTIVTTNLTVEQVRESTDVRVWDRLRRGAVVIAVLGENRRAQ